MPEISDAAAIHARNRTNATLGRLSRKYGKGRALNMVAAVSEVMVAADYLPDEIESGPRMARDRLIEMFQLCVELQAISQDVFS